MRCMVKAWRDSTWTTAQLVFNSRVWANDWRLWGSSKKLTIIMRKNQSEEIFGDSEETEIVWQRTELKTSCFSPYMTTWKKEGTDLQPQTVDFSIMQPI
jgi:hypothetical protein